MDENNFEVRDEDAEASLRKIGKLLATATPKGMGFAFLLFDYGEAGNMFYISSADREDMCKAMHEFLAKQENNNDKPN